CFYGIDFSSKGELIACSKSVQQICDFIEADSLAYLSLDGMFRAMPIPAKDFCSACFTGKYPIQITDDSTKHCLEMNTDEPNVWP
ncbi:MAG: amidophosphoribosyltransferase, partial [Deltaproteobacteria bacterium]|nr:amidophosphoribosyltransferase [Deltaproteobacteria bacterium]